MRLFNIDLHISVIADIKNVFKTINPDIEIIDWSLSGHKWVFNSSPDSVKIITAASWSNLTLELIERFQEEYDEFLQTFDGFLACHPNSFFLLYEKYNKPIIIINTCRYDLPFCWNKNFYMIQEFQERLKIHQAKNLLYVVSNNLADNEYFKLANPTIETEIIPSLCLYTNMIYNKNHTYTKFLLYTGNIPDHPLIEKRPHNYKWQDLANYKGIIHIPYEASTMSIFEHLSSGIPLFFPTKQFLKALWDSGTEKQMNYWGQPPEYLEQTKYDEFWLERADFYEFEGIYYFDSYAELFALLENFEDTKYDTRIEYIETRKKQVYEKYIELLEIIEKRSEFFLSNN